jgi:hypothetical protein
MVQKSTSSCRSVFGERLISVWPVKRRNEAPESSTFSKLNCLRYRNVNASARATMSGIAITACKQNHPTRSRLSGTNFPRGATFEVCALLMLSRAGGQQP